MPLYFVLLLELLIRVILRLFQVISELVALFLCLNKIDFLNLG